MEIQGRTYMTNGQSILLKDYQDIKNARSNFDNEMQNSLGSLAYQTSSKFPLNNNNNPNLKYPEQSFGNTMNQMANSNGFEQSYQNNFGQTYNNVNNNMNMTNMSRTQDMKKAKTFSPGQEINENNAQTYQLTPESRRQLELEVEKLYDYYYMTKGYFQSEPGELFNFYLDFKRRYNKGVRVPKKLENLILFREIDVEECLNAFINKVKNRFKSGYLRENSSTYQNSGFKRSISAKKTFDNNIKNTYHLKLTKETQERLYPRLKEIEKREREKQNCEDFNTYFKKLLEKFKSDRGYYTNDKDVLIDYYKNLPKKEEKNMEWENGETDFIENMELFFNDEEIIQRLSDIFYKQTKLRTYHSTTLHNHWQHFMKEKDRYLNGLNKYSKDDFYSILTNYYKKREEEKKDNIYQQEKEEKARREQEEIERRNRIRETQEEREQLINELAQPKDKYKTGRVMLQLKDQFKYDNIIKKMIRNEFRDNKIFKFPEEYAVRDEDEQKDIFFKHDLDTSIREKNPEKKIEKEIEKAYDRYNSEKEERRPKINKANKQKKDLFDFIKKKVIEYFKRMESRLSNDKQGVESINIFLNNLYKEMSKNHREATKIYFKRPRLEVLKKTYRYKKIQTFYPKKLKFYFFRLLRRLGRDAHGKLVFARNDNIPFWSPSLSNKCKIHGNNCPIYCCYNTHNKMIKESRDKNFNTNFNIKGCKKKLEEKEVLNLWKRPDLKDKKEKIFMCFDDAEHCTFEPKLQKPPYKLDKETIIKSRLNNDNWVKDMGPSFTLVRGTIYKEGILKQAKILFSEGRYEETENLLKKAFDLDVFKTYKPRYLLKPGEENKFIANKPEEKKEEKKEGEIKEEKKEEKKEEEKNQGNNNIIQMPGFQRKIDLSKPIENFTNEKNLELLDEIYFMLEVIKKYKNRQQKQSKHLKREMNMINHEKGLSGKKIVVTKKIDSKDIYDPNKNIKYGLMKKKYFNPVSTMCKNGDNCPYYLKGEKCPYGAHQISELKFKAQISENIKLRKNLIKRLDEEPEPVIEESWVPTGRLCTCKMAEGSGGNCKCGFCKYRHGNKRAVKKKEPKFKKHVEENSNKKEAEIKN